MGIKLKPHNEKTYERVSKMFKTGNTAAVVHPTGTGKTFVALKWIEETQGKVIYVSPNKHILNQVKEDIKKAKENGELTEEQVKRYENIKYMTYTELMEQSKLGLDYDQIILDEFHRCGAPEWGKGVQRLIEQNPKAQILGLTATPVRAKDNKDMAEELFKDRVASEMTLEQAVADGIIPIPTYINAIYSVIDVIKETEGQLEKVQNAAQKRELKKKLKTLKKQLGNIEGIEEIFEKYANKPDGKYIVFCSDLKDMHKKMKESKTWFSKVGETRLYEISYKKREEANQETLERFKTEGGKINLLFTVDKLNEGIHIDGIDGVIMLRKTTSPIVYMQQLGRALSAGNEGTPLIFDFANNIESSKYIYRFAEKVRNIRNKGEIADQEQISFKIIEVQKEVKEILEEIRNKLDRRTIQDKIKYLVGLGDIGSIGQKDIGENGETIGIWKWQIKKAYKQGRLTKEEVAKLEEAGMQWNEREGDVNLQRKINGLIAHGNISEIRVRQKAQNGDNIGQWKKDIKIAYKEGKLTKKDIAALEEAGIQWNEKAGNLSLDDKVEILIRQGDIGSIRQDTVLEDGTKIGQIKWQVRTAYKAGKLSEEQIKLLEAKGETWKDRKRLTELKKKKHETEEKVEQAEKLLRQYERQNEGKSVVDE